VRWVAHAVGESPVELWGVSSRTRLARQLAGCLGEVEWLDDPEPVRPGTRALLVRADYLFETRALAGLTEYDQAVLRCGEDGAPVAACVPGEHAAQAAALLRGELESVPPALAVVEPRDLGHYDPKLRRAEAPLVAAIDAESRAALESTLYGSAYKGITDLVTKWLWPRPARHAVRLCTRLGITPHAVTILGAVLVVLAGWAFFAGAYALGLLAAWVMTFLDTVDGKLARVTERSSRLGHYLDHGIDLVHPPFWYILWGMGLASFEPVLGLERVALYWIIASGYVGGRVTEALFHLLGDCSIFTWRPFDSYFRLVTARRNPCLIVLTVAAILGHPAWGLIGVAGWTALTTLVLLTRLLQGTLTRMRQGRLDSWLSEGPERARHARAYATFASTRTAYDGAAPRPE